jgi:hypothetical protein
MADYLLPGLKVPGQPNTRDLKFWYEREEISTMKMRGTRTRRCFRRMKRMRKLGVKTRTADLTKLKDSSLYQMCCHTVNMSEGCLIN